jgi:hypothetical protein
MRARSLWSPALVLAALSCSSEEPGDLNGTAVPVDPGSCIEVGVVPPVRYGGAASFWGNHLGAGIDVDLGGGGYHKFTIRFGHGDGFDPVPGEFELGTGVEGAFATCDHCVMVMENVWGDNVNRLNFASSGTMRLAALDPARGEYRGRVENVVLQPLVYTNQHHVWAGFENTDYCLFIRAADFDTFAGVGEACSTSGDCYNSATQVCDPSTARCIEAPCSKDAPACGDGEVCVIQSPAYGTGACFPTCTPFASGACPDGFECNSVSYDGSSGVCKASGDGALGTKECAVSTTSTGCVAGAVCQTVSTFWPREQYCFETCDYFGADPSCGEGVCQIKFYRDKDFKQYCYDDRCYRGGTCRETEAIDPASLGQTCTKNANSPCASDGVRALGICDADTDNTCLELCELETPSCAHGGSCRQYYVRDDGNSAVAGIGVCE